MKHFALSLFRRVAMTLRRRPAMMSRHQIERARRELIDAVSVQERHLREVPLAAETRALVARATRDMAAMGAALGAVTGENPLETRQLRNLVRIARVVNESAKCGSN